jgi:cell division protein FtsL
MERSTNRIALQQRLTEIEAKVEGMQHQIGEQREVIAKLESVGRLADHAKYLLAGLELLEAAYRDNRNEIVANLSRSLD